MGESTSQCFAIFVMSWPVWLRSTCRCHAMMPNTSSETSTPMGCNWRISAIQEIGDHVITVQLWVFLKGKLRVGLVAFGREADIVKLDFVHAGRGHILGQRDVVILHFLIRAV